LLTHFKYLLHVLGSYTILYNMPLNPSDFRTPGQFLRALLDEKGWNHQLLAVVLGITRQAVGRIARDEKPVDAPLALTLGNIFGVDPETFLHLQHEYDLAKAKITARPDPTLAHRARLYGDLPLTEMIARGWIDASDIRDVNQVESELARFFGVAAVQDIEILPHAAKRTNVLGEVTPTQLAWLHRVRQIARTLVVPRYSTAALQSAVTAMRSLLRSPEEARKAPRLLAEAGVRLVIVESLYGAKTDGVCFWLDDRSPVIGLSLRYDRIDNFWFVLRHECEHVLRGDGLTAISIDAELERERAGSGPEVEEQERIANTAAADFCVPSKSLDQFIARKAPVFTRRDIVGFANVVKVHPGLIAGQLQKATGRYERFRDHLVPIRSIVLPNVVHDGWGDVPQLAR
jgi:HTH-type transcriptional regulator / antitoxin HigA